MNFQEKSNFIQDLANEDPNTVGPIARLALGCERISVGFTESSCYMPRSAMVRIIRLKSLGFQIEFRLTVAVGMAPDLRCLTATIRAAPKCKTMTAKKKSSQSNPQLRSVHFQIC